MVPTAVSVVPTPSCDSVHKGKTPGQGSVVPTTVSVVPPSSNGEDSGKLITDLQPCGEGIFFSFLLSFSLFMSNLVLTPPTRPVPDDGIII